MKKAFIITAIFLLVVVRIVIAQYAIVYPRWYPATKFEKLYVLSGDTATPYAKEIFTIIKDNWKISPVFFMQGRSIHIPDNLLVKGNLFLSMGMFSRNQTFVRENGTRGETVSNDYFHLDLWTMEDTYNPKYSVSENAFTVASAELYNRTIGMDKISNGSGGDFTSSLFPGDYCNGLKGNIKNMIQYFNSQLPLGNSRKLLQDQPPATEITNLAKDILYMPNYWYGDVGTMLEEEKETSSDYRRTAEYIDKVIAAYHYKIKLVARLELDKMILAADKNLYYLNYIQSSADKIISVVNGLNGNVIYSEVNKKSYRIKGSDLEKIGKAVQ